MLLLNKNAVFLLWGFKKAAYHAFSEQHLKLKGHESLLQKPSLMTTTIVVKAATFVAVVVVIIKLYFVLTVSGCRNLKDILKGFMLKYQKYTR